MANKYELKDENGLVICICEFPPQCCRGECDLYNTDQCIEENCNLIKNCE